MVVIILLKIGCFETCGLAILDCSHLEKDLKEHQRHKVITLTHRKELMW